MNLAMMDEHVAGRIDEHRRVEDFVAGTFDQTRAHEHAAFPCRHAESLAGWSIGNGVCLCQGGWMSPTQRQGLGQQHDVSVARIPNATLRAFEIGGFVPRLNEHLRNGQSHRSSNALQVVPLRTRAFSGVSREMDWFGMYSIA